VQVRAYDTTTDEEWAKGLLGRRLGGRNQARRGELIDMLSLEGLIAEDERGRLGILLYQRDEDECELAAIATEEGQHGVGTALLDALKFAAGDCERIWVVTTNDNLDALRFYQRRGFVLSALRSGAVDESRRTLKPSISATGAYGIPLRDELELEFRLGRG
jgi:ribosomal protein S18 acetylase RimI-like enzyme